MPKKLHSFLLTVMILQVLAPTNIVFRWHRKTDWKLCSSESGGSPVALGLLIFIIIILLLTAAFIIFKKRRSHFSSTIRYERTLDESDTTSIITAADWVCSSNQPQGVLTCLMQMQLHLLFFLNYLFFLLQRVLCKYCWRISAKTHS